MTGTDAGQGARAGKGEGAQQQPKAVALALAAALNRDDKDSERGGRDARDQSVRAAYGDASGKLFDDRDRRRGDESLKGGMKRCIVLVEAEGDRPQSCAPAVWLFWGGWARVTGSKAVALQCGCSGVVGQM
eukprot:CAMPEP_0202364348 /NCGR_PEP_ID=MMETSP1126-20121109/15791_1 /ASSEMBLY_ACC=CAM_ASM_000457 /TAXON_ID=3047 /ORGANISM="Dunaliella tertiolecta, Strain CCMP1320" /LENGTH=130 /DNA_ID=CAMNT_0048958971 /DNA_START=159 /DNA_END=554 /DNA_ORIENTATION=+